MSDVFSENLVEHAAVVARMNQISESVQRAARILVDTVVSGGKVMLCGNGGSAADAQHIAAEFVGRFIDDREPIAALALTTDSSALTCIGNDYSYDTIFSRQMLALARPGDCLVGISTSGNSRNVILAVDAAKNAGVKTVGLLGRSGGEIGKMCDVSIIIPSDSTARIQEMHILIGHTLVGIVENQIGSGR